MSPILGTDRGSYIFAAMKDSPSLWTHQFQFKMWKLRWQPLREKMLYSLMTGYNLKKIWKSLPKAPQNTVYGICHPFIGFLLIRFPSVNEVSI